MQALTGDNGTISNPNLYQRLSQAHENANHAVNLSPEKVQVVSIDLLRSAIIAITKKLTALPLSTMLAIWHRRVKEAVKDIDMPLLGLLLMSTKPDIDSLPDDAPTDAPASVWPRAHAIMQSASRQFLLCSVPLSERIALCALG